MLYGYPQQWIKILNEKIKMVHFKDFRKGSASLSGFVDLLSGDVDFIEVMKALHTINYNNWITAEVSTYRQFPEQSAISCSAAMDKILGMSLT
jgi:hexulose-6-phosphate isomerase